MDKKCNFSDEGRQMVCNLSSWTKKRNNGTGSRKLLLSTRSSFATSFWKMWNRRCLEASKSHFVPDKHDLPQMERFHGQIFIIRIPKKSNFKKRSGSQPSKAYDLGLPQSPKNGFQERDKGTLTMEAVSIMGFWGWYVPHRSLPITCWHK